MNPTITELERLKREVDDQLGQVRNLTEELRATEFAARAGGVEAVVDGQGGLVDLRIDADAVGPRVAHPELVGPRIVEAVAAARRAAADEQARRFHTVVPGMFPLPAEPEPDREPDGWQPGGYFEDDE